MTAATPEPAPLSYDAVVEKIRAGVLRGKSVSLPAEAITEATAFWAGGDPDQPCLAFD
jgi:hypothetical protein